MSEFEISSRAKLPRDRSKPRTPQSIARAIKAYQEQYNRVYGKKPEGRYDAKTKFIYIGNSGGVGIVRLKQLIRQLKDTEAGTWIS